MQETLEITIPAQEAYDEDRNEFYDLFGDTTLQLKHSLLSIQKWEQRWHKPFLDNTKGEKTLEETKDYVRCMTINKGVNPLVYDYIPSKWFPIIKQYIEDPMTATWFSDDPNEPHGYSPTQTAETIYADMITLNIPSDYAKWHLNSLLTLIKVCAIRQQPPKKMSAQDTVAHYAKLNKLHKAKGIH